MPPEEGDDVCMGGQGLTVPLRRLRPLHEDTNEDNSADDDKDNSAGDKEPNSKDKYELAE